MTTPTISDWTAYLHEQMPLTAAMGIQIRQASVGGALIDVPFGPNQNHADSVFGGSLSVAGIVAGWLLVQARAAEAFEQRVQVVIQESQCRYIRPVTEAFQVSAQWPTADPWPNVEQAFERAGRARVEVRSEVLDPGGAGRLLLPTTGFTWSQPANRPVATR